MLILWFVAGAASGASEVSLHAQAGWSGWVPLGAWIPVRADLHSPDAVDGAIVVDIPTRDPSGPMSFRQRVRLAPGVRQRVTLDVIVPEARKALIIRFVSQGRDLAREEIPLSLRSAVDGVVLVLTREPSGLERLSDLSRKLRPAYITDAELPVRWQNYAGVSLLVIHDLDPQGVRPDQQEALEQWVAQGGRLVVTGGEPLLRLRGSWIGRLLPADPVGLSQMNAPTELPGFRGPILATVLSVRAGAVMPGRMKAQWQWGAGAVTVWAVDLLAPALRTWDGQGTLWEEALNTPVRPWLVSRDLIRVLPSSRPMPVGVQVLFAVLAVVYIGAARGVLVRAIRFRSGWLLVLAVTAAFAPVMYGFGLWVRHVGTVAVQASVVEGIAGAEVARVRTAVAMLSPYDGAFELTAPAWASVQPIEPLALTFDGPAALHGTAPASGLQLDVLQMVPTPVRGRVRGSPEGLRVEIFPRGALSVDEPVLVRRGQIYRLPRITGALSVPLDPGQWEAFKPRPETPRDQGDRLQFEVLARLAHQLEGPGASVWLVGRIDTPQLSVRGRPMLVETHQVLAVPLQIEEGRP